MAMYKRLRSLGVANLVIVAGALWMFSMVFVVMYVKKEHPLYLWDFGGYFEAYYNYGELLRKDSSAFVGRLVKSIYVDDYNALPTVPLLPFNFMFERSRTGYIASLVTCYLVPAVLLTTCTAYAIARRDDWSEKPETRFSVVTFLLFVALGHGYWAPTLRGYPDIGALVFIACATLYFFSVPLHGALKWHQALIFGVLAILPFVFRRWYAYSVMAFYLSAFMVSCHDWYGAGGNPGGRPRFGRLVLNYLLAASFSGLLVFSLQWGLVRKIWATSYSDIYDAYQISFVDQVDNIYNAFGSMLVILAVSGFVVSIFDRRYKKLGIFFFCNLVVTWGLFITTQAPSVQHVLPLFFWAYLLSFIFVDWSMGRLEKNIHKCLLGLSMVIFSVLSFSHVLIGDMETLQGVLPQYRFHRLTYAGAWDVYLRLQEDLQRLLAPSSERLSIFSSNMLLSDSLLCATGSELLRGRINFVSQVDKRDRFDLRSLQSEIMVIADPVQYHLRPESQRVIGIPATMIRNGTGFGEAYDLISDAYELAPGVRAYIYKRKRPVTLAEVDDLLSRYYAIYPEWKRTYTNFDVILATMNRVLGDKWGKVRTEPDNRLFIHPGERTPTKISFATEKRIASIGLKAWIPPSAAESCGSAGGDVTLDLFGDGVRLLTENITHQKGFSTSLSVSNYDRLEFWVGNNGSPNCDWLFLQLDPAIRMDSGISKTFPGAI